MGDGNAIGCPVTAEPQFLQLLHTLSASRFMFDFLLVFLVEIAVEHGPKDRNIKVHLLADKDSPTVHNQTDVVPLVALDGDVHLSLAHKPIKLNHLLQCTGALVVERVGALNKN
ncbi:hypothetical protein PRIPAC_86627 [Pristionchus pacificus]|uniref:Uncharacterized protein n=1 Tax=Pristionchus pacificus TaxID=54126 RepID=A0A2A6BME3_PRIPA|nr:hypothetical protein PRIPAC_86627 [Pristionchus pacificus]|eukprot:PDM66983.1 hypothetical protein PRIPAC_48400 [Pristionchus pacificus]